MSKSGEKWTWRNWHHKYVELHVRAMERVPALDKPVSVPGWYQKVWNMPDSVTRGGKTLAYHVGHYTAILFPLAALFGLSSKK